MDLDFHNVQCVTEKPVFERFAGVFIPKSSLDFVSGFEGE